MSDTTDTPVGFVGLPWSGRGVAEFADARFTQVFRRQLAFAAIAAISICLGLWRTWFPVIREAIGRFPPRVEIRGGELSWPAPDSRLLADNGFLGIAVDPANRGAPSRTADFQFTFRQTGARIDGLFGATEIPYAEGWVIALDRLTVTSWWDAWSWVVLLGIGLLAAMFVILAWWTLALPYALLPWAVATLFRRNLGFAGGWRVAAGALLTGSVPLSLGFVAYALHAIRLPGLLILTAVHFVVGWIWLAWGTLAWLLLHRRAGNPFKPSASSKAGESKARAGRNPFNR